MPLIDSNHRRRLRGAWSLPQRLKHDAGHAHCKFHWTLLASPHRTCRRQRIHPEAILSGVVAFLQLHFLAAIIHLAHPDRIVALLKLAHRGMVALSIMSRRSNCHSNIKILSSHDSTLLNSATLNCSLPLPPPRQHCVRSLFVGVVANMNTATFLRSTVLSASEL